MVGSSVRQYGGNITVFSGINHISFRSIHPGDIINPQEYTSYEYFNSAYLGVRSTELSEETKNIIKRAAYASL